MSIHHAQHLLNLIGTTFWFRELEEEEFLRLQSKLYCFTTIKPYKARTSRKLFSVWSLFKYGVKNNGLCPNLTPNLFAQHHYPHNASPVLNF